MNGGETESLRPSQDFGSYITDSTRSRASTEAEFAFESVFLEHYERVLGILLRLTGNRAQAEEVANEVFWRLSKRPPSWLLTSNVGAWLYRSATNAGIDALRTAAHRKHYEHAAALNTRDQAAPEAEPLNQVLRQEDRESVRRVLSGMKPAQAQILLMRAGGSSYKELADALNVAVGGVGTLLNRAESAFRKRYLKLTGKEER